MVLSESPEFSGACIAHQGGLPVIHVGLAKTGSTFLQNNFFTLLTDFHYETPQRYWHSALGWVFTINRELERHLHKPDLRRWLRRRPVFDRERSLQESRHYLGGLNQRILLSSEGLAGVGSCPPRNNGEITDFLRDIFPEAKIIFIFRQQANYCESIYKQIVFKENRFKRYLEFEQFYRAPKQRVSNNDYSELNWLAVYHNYTRNFGEENVLALPYEMMQSDLGGFMARLQEFMGTDVALGKDFFKVKENVSSDSYSYPSGNGQRLLSAHNFSGLNDGLRQVIMTAVARSNEELGRALGIDLGAFRYY